MPTIQAARRGLERGLEYLEYQIKSDSRKYSKTLNHVRELRSIAQKIISISDEILNCSETALDEICNIDDMKVLDLKKFKNCLNETSLSSEELFIDKNVKLCSLAVFDYFNTRFDSRNDPNRIHKFHQNEYGLYLFSIVASFCLKWNNLEVEKFFEEFSNFVENVKSHECVYTLPKSSFEIFKSIKRGNWKISQDDYNLIESVWSNLLDLGYSHCTNFIGLNGVWVNSLSEVCQVYEGNEDSIKSVFLKSFQSMKSKFRVTDDEKGLMECFMLFYEFTLSPSYEVILSECLSRFEFMKFFVSSDSELSLVTACKSLILYSSRHGIDKTKEHLDNMIKLEKDLCLKVNNFDDMVEFVSHSEISDYFIIEILEEYYETVRNIYEL